MHPINDNNSNKQTKKKIPQNLATISSTSKTKL